MVSLQSIFSIEESFFYDKDVKHLKFKDELIKTALIFSKLDEISSYLCVFSGLRDFRY
jgi:hypothetical protein